MKYKLLPEDGILASDSYTNRFFGFSIDLPIASEGHQITIPVMAEKQHALLAIGFERGKHFGRFIVTAEESPRELPWYEDLQQEQCKDAPDTGSQQRVSIPSFMLHYGSFYAHKGRSGSYHIDHYWTRIKNYIIRVAVDSNDQEFLNKSKDALVKAQFYCASKSGTLTTKEGKVFVAKGEPYEGPTVPTWLVDAAITDKPGAGIPAGAVSDGMYHNPELGLQYEFPNGWEVLAMEPDGDRPENERKLREYELLHACSRTLLHVGKRGSSGAGQSPRPSIILRALDPNCLAMRTPASVEDKKTAEDITAALQLFSEFGEIKSDELTFLGNRLFLIFHGTIGLRASGEALSSRMSEALFVTQQHKLFLMWYLMAPTSAELAVMPPTSVTFDDSQPITLPPAKLAR